MVNMRESRVGSLVNKFGEGTNKYRVIGYAQSSGTPLLNEIKNA